MSKRKQSATVDLKLRVKEPLRADIERDARRRGISMNAEMVRRLEQTTQRAEWLGGRRVTSILETVATAMRAVGEHGAFMATSKLHKEGAWLDHPYAFDQATKAAITILENHRPKGEIVMPKPNVVEVIGGDAKESKDQHRRIYAELGELYAFKALRDQEEKK